MATTEDGLTPAQRRIYNFINEHRIMMFITMSPKDHEHVKGLVERGLIRADNLKLGYVLDKSATVVEIKAKTKRTLARIQELRDLRKRVLITAHALMNEGTRRDADTANDLLTASKAIRTAMRKLQGAPPDEPPESEVIPGPGKKGN